MPTLSKYATNISGIFVALALATQAMQAQLIGPTPIPAKADKKTKAPRSDAEWLWQYSPPPAEGRENELIRDPRFRPFLEQNLRAPQAFWGVQKSSPNAPRRSLVDTAMDFLSIPGKVIAEDNRYLTITGCVFHFCPARGLLWVDLNTPRALVIFAAVDWTTENRTPSDPAAEYTVWIFANRPLAAPDGTQPGDTGIPAHIPNAFLTSLTRWTAEPTPGTTFRPHITTAVMVDPDGTPHTVPLGTLGISGPPKQNPLDTSEQPK